MRQRIARTSPRSRRLCVAAVPTSARLVSLVLEGSSIISFVARCSSCWYHLRHAGLYGRCWAVKSSRGILRDDVREVLFYLSSSFSPCLFCCSLPLCSLSLHHYAPLFLILSLFAFFVVASLCSLSSNTSSHTQILFVSTHSLRFSLLTASQILSPAVGLDRPHA